jgi:hypothetical protein
LFRIRLAVALDNEFTNAHDEGLLLSGDAADRLD